MPWRLQQLFLQKPAFLPNKFLDEQHHFETMVFFKKNGWEAPIPGGACSIESVLSTKQPNARLSRLQMQYLR
jgi:hypothetical protein